MQSGEDQTLQENNEDFLKKYLTIKLFWSILWLSK